MSQRKNLQIAIDALATKVKIQQIEVAEHKRYFTRLVNNNFVFLAATLIPVFLTGWQMAKSAKTGKLMRQFAKFSLFTVLDTVRHKQRPL